MAKKKTSLKSVFKNKLTKTQIIFSLLFILILFTLLGLFFFSTDAGLQNRMLIYTRLLQAKNNYTDYMQSLAPTPTPQPTPMVVADGYPPVTPSQKLTTIITDELIVKRTTKQEVGTVPALSQFKTINNPPVVQKLYNAILVLTPFPTSPPEVPLVGHCVANPNLVLYDLTFLRKGTPVAHGIITLLGCSGGFYINMDESYKQEINLPFIKLYANSLGITEDEVYPGLDN